MISARLKVFFKTQKDFCRVKAEILLFVLRTSFGFLRSNGHGGSLVVFVCCPWDHENESRLRAVRWLPRRCFVVDASQIPSRFSEVRRREMENTSLRSQVVLLNGVRTKLVDLCYFGFAYFVFRLSDQSSRFVLIIVICLCLYLRQSKLHCSLLFSVTIRSYIFFYSQFDLDLAAAWENVGEAKSAVSIVIFLACFVWFQSHRWSTR